jgi:prepilin-type N-terminal cleavage/methylation domain-containing protein
MYRTITRNGFTIVEMVVVIGVLSIIIPSIFAILFANIRARTKVHILQEVKTNGDNVLSTMEYLIKVDGVSLHSAVPATNDNKICDSPGTTYSERIYIKDKNNNAFSFYVENDKIASAAAVGATPTIVPHYLTSDNVRITSFIFTCEGRAGINSPIMSVSYTVSQLNDTEKKAEEKASMNYRTKIKLRYYE